MGQEERAVVLTQYESEICKQINEEGLLPKEQLMAYNVFFSHGKGKGMTSGEVTNVLISKRGPRPHESTHKRLGELVERGVLRVGGIRKCRITGKECSVYFVIEQLPVRPPTREKKSRERYECPKCEYQFELKDARKAEHASEEETE